MNIALILTQPESKTLEFKRDLSSIKPILKTIVAFANTAGGTLIIGHSPETGISGVEDVFLSEESLVNAIADSISPSLFPDIEIKTIDGKNILIVRVAHQNGPYYLRAEGEQDGVYLRFGSTTRKASPEILEDLRRSTAKLFFDQLICADLDESALDEVKVESFFNKIGKIKDRETALETLGVLMPHNGTLKVSNGGLILFGKDHLRERFFPDARISCARFQGTDKAHFIDRQDIEGSVIESLDTALKFIKRNTRLGSIIQSIQREDIPEYPEIPLREVLINAIAHSNYAIHGRIFVSIFSDRLEVQNSGMFPYGMTLDDFKSGLSHVRNKVIARICRELKMIEEWGSGYHRIVSHCNEFGYPVPEWQEFGTATRVIFRPHSFFHEASEQESVFVPVVDYEADLSDRQHEIISILKKYGAQKMKEISGHLKSPPADRTLRDDLSVLRDKGIIDSKGARRIAKWFLTKSSVV